MLNFGASKPRSGGGPGPRGPPWIRTCHLRYQWRIQDFLEGYAKQKGRESIICQNFAKN